MSLTDISDLKKLDDLQLSNVLDNLFEPCGALKNYLVPKIRLQSFANYSELIEFSRTKLLNLVDAYSKNDKDTRIKDLICKIVLAHPRLGVPRKQISLLSEHSKNEQKSLSSNDPDGILAIKLKQLNDEYEATFPGLIFVVFVNGRSRNEIMEIMRNRIKNSNWLDEVKIAFNSMADIALDRAKKLNGKL